MQKIQRTELAQSKVAGGCNKGNTTVVQQSGGGSNTAVIIGKK